MDLRVVDLEACGRRDLGTFAIVGTGQTTHHCRRLGDLVARTLKDLKIPALDAFCWGTKNDEWVLARCGPYAVHLFTQSAREEYQLEALWTRPHDHLTLEDFPHYGEPSGVGGGNELPPYLRLSMRPTAVIQDEDSEVYNQMQLADYSSDAYVGVDPYLDRTKR
mmetsp:Transcript_34479/g.89868  ORF Transcript_34479/g.89868 Transcript_34479/m.89868 type:complete len:164 (+) Transcript_34479:818-1309(+)